MKIVGMHNNRQANYSQYWRTTDLDSLVTIKGRTETVLGTTYTQPSWVKIGVTYGFDCSSTVGCCYDQAGISYMKGLSCAAGTLQSTAKVMEQNSGDMQIVDFLNVSQEILLCMQIMDIL